MREIVANFKLIADTVAEGSPDQRDLVRRLQTQVTQVLGKLANTLAAAMTSGTYSGRGLDELRAKETNAVAAALDRIEQAELGGLVASLEQTRRALVDLPVSLNLRKQDQLLRRLEGMDTTSVLALALGTEDVDVIHAVRDLTIVELAVNPDRDRLAERAGATSLGLLTTAELERVIMNFMRRRDPALGDRYDAFEAAVSVGRFVLNSARTELKTLVEYEVGSH